MRTDFGVMCSKWDLARMNIYNEKRNGNILLRWVEIKSLIKKVRCYRESAGKRKIRELSNHQSNRIMSCSRLIWKRCLETLAKRPNKKLFSSS